VSTTTTSFQKGVQYGFYFDQGRCVDCKTCSVACKSWYNIGPGPARNLRLMSWEEGTFPNVAMNAIFAPCYHCQNPVCIPAANGAIYKESNYGAVLIDPQKANSSSLRAAWDACPYGAIVFDSDSPTATAYKCTMCIDRLNVGLLPACVASCYMRALDFGPLSQLQAKYGTNADLPGMPSSTTVKPSVVFKGKIPKKTLVPYDASRAVTLMAKRDPLPALYSDPSVLTPKPGVVGRAALNMKPKSAAELTMATQNDEG